MTPDTARALQALLDRMLSVTAEQLADVISEHAAAADQLRPMFASERAAYLVLTVRPAHLATEYRMHAVERLSHLPGDLVAAAEPAIGWVIDALLVRSEIGRLITEVEYSDLVTPWTLAVGSVHPADLPPSCFRSYRARPTALVMAR